MSEHFVIAGAQRCGTTFLARALAAHPEIEMARTERPEPKFFLHDDPGAGAAERYRRTYFGHKPGARRFGEKSTSYLEHEHVAQRLQHHLPGVKVVVVVRDPVERAISHVRFSQREGLESRTLTEALCPGGPPPPPWDPDAVSVDPFAYIVRSRYVDYLEAFLRHIPRRQLYVIVFEEMVASPQPVQGVLQFLEVDPSETLVRSEVGDAVVSGSGEQIECRRELARELQASILRLEGLLGRSLDCWPSRG